MRGDTARAVPAAHLEDPQHQVAVRLQLCGVLGAGAMGIGCLHTRHTIATHAPVPYRLGIGGAALLEGSELLLGGGGGLGCSGQLSLERRNLALCRMQVRLDARRVLLLDLIHHNHRHHRAAGAALGNLVLHE